MKETKRVSRVVYGVYVLVVAAFVVSNISQVAHTLFGSPGRSAPSERTSADALDPACAERAATYIKAIDAARAAAVLETDVEASHVAYAREREATLSRAGIGGPSALERACERDPRSLDALAAVTRLDRVSESSASRMIDELSPVRTSARSSISGSTR